jgi:hypothetical protein
MSDTTPLPTVEAHPADLLCWRLQTAWLGWHSGQPTPRWQDHLPATGAADSAELIYRLVQTDIEGRIQAGLPALLSERYFQHPRWQHEERLDSRREGELIRWEYQQRVQSGQRPSRSNYQDAFPNTPASWRRPTQR